MREDLGYINPPGLACFHCRFPISFHVTTGFVPFAFISSVPWDRFWSGPCHSSFKMPLLSAYGLQALTLFVALSVSSPLSAYSKRQDLTLDRCARPDLPSDNRCWKLADVRNYLINQTTGWIKTTPICDDPTRCCGPAEEWSTCFLRLALGRPGQNCTTVESGSCTVIGGLDPNLHPSIVPQVRYTVQGIYGVNELYTIYSQGILSTTSSPYGIR